MSGILLLVPLSAPAHAINPQQPTLSYVQEYAPPLVGDGYDNYLVIQITNPATNTYAITGFTLSFSLPGFAANTWEVFDCDWTSGVFAGATCPDTNSASFFGGSGYSGIVPGTTAWIYLGVETPVDQPSTVFPLSATITTTLQDASSAAYYTGPSENIQVISPDSYLSFNLTPGGSNTDTTYTAGTAPYSLTATVSCPDTSYGCPSSGYETGVQTFFAVYNMTSDEYQTQGLSVTEGNSGASGTISTVVTPSNHAGQEEYVTGSFGAGGVISGEINLYQWTLRDDFTDTSDITTVPGTPASVGFQLSAATFPNIDWLPTQGTTTNTGTSGTFTGAELDIGTTPVGISVTDKYGNQETFGAGGVTFVGASQDILVQTASGGLFDTTNLPSSITCGVTADFTCPTSGSSVAEPFNYYQGANYGTAGVLTATITGTFDGSTFSVSGSSGTIETSTFSATGLGTGTGQFETTGHAVLTAKNVQAGKSITFEVALGTVQADVPVTVAVCDTGTCAGTTSGYSGTIASASGVTNSSGIYSTTLTVDTTATHAAILNASVLAPMNGTPKNHYYIVSPAITTIAGPAAKFTVVVGPDASLSPSYITKSIGGTLYVNVVTTDAYGNGVTNVGAEQIQINLVANPNTITVASAYIPTNCYETNGTSDNGCSATFSSFGPIAWTLPTTVGSVGTISASGVLNGVLVTSATQTITVVSKLPTLSIFQPKPLNNIIYTNTPTVQFRGWANVSVGYNNCVGGMCPAEITMSSLGWKIGSASWQTTGLAGTNAQWSVIPTLATGLNTVTFNATDSKSNTVVSSAYTVLVDTTTPTVTDVTPAGATLNPGQLFTATIVAPEGDLNTTYGSEGLQVTYNGTVLSGSSVQLSGTNNPGSSVTYTLTAALPTSVGNPGHWSVVVSAETLAGNTGQSTPELVSVTVAFADSITFTTGSATWGQSGASSGLFVPVTNLWSTSQQLTIYATLKEGSSTYVVVGGETLAAGQTGTVFLQDYLVAVPAGTYSVTFSAQTTANSAVSAPTTPITITVP